MILRLLLALAPLPAHASDTPGELAAAWGTPPAATWIFALETAGGMRPVAEAAREPIARFVESLPAGDRVEVVAIHTRAGAALQRTVEDAGRATLAADIRALELPSAKSLDLGAALVELGTRLEAAPDATPRFVFYVGTFCHAPPLGSGFADGGYGCRSIRGLDALETGVDASRWSSFTTGLFFPVSTPEQAAHEPGITQIRAWFEPNATVDRVTEPLATWLDTARARLADERMRPLVRQEAAAVKLSARVSKVPTLEEPKGTLVLASGLTHLGFEAATVTLEGATTDTRALHLAPEAELPFEVVVPKAPFSLVPTHDTVDIPVKITVQGALTPTAPLRALGVSVAPPPLTAEVAVRAERHYGLSLGRSAAMFGSALLLVGAVGLTVRRRVRPLALGGAFTWRRAGGPRQTLPIAHLAEAAIVVLPDGGLGLGRREEAVLVLFVERPLWKAHAVAEIRGPGVEINARPADRGRHAVIAGATSFAFQDYRLSWE